MKVSNKSTFAILFGVLLLTVLGMILVRQTQVKEAVSPDLERLVDIHPQSWVSANTLVTSPAWKETAEEQYDNIEARSYRNANGEMVTVVMTWSRNGLQKAGHIQQLCYSSQGFSISEPKNIDIKLAHKTIPVTTFSASRLGGEVEDVFYWRLTGGRLLNNLLETGFGNYRLSHRILKFKEILGHLAGEIPDNIMIRVSSVRQSNDEPSRVPIEYLHQYIKLLSESDKKLLLGN